MVFYMYDLEEYENEIRGFYFPASDLPGPIARTEEELFDVLNNIEMMSDRYASKYKAFNEKFNYLDDGNAARRVVDELKMES